MSATPFANVDKEDRADGSPFPALDALNQAQTQALDRFREAGFESRRDLLIWLHELEYQTLGRMPWWWHYEMATKSAALEVLITGEEADRYRDEVSPATAREERRHLAAKYLRPAFRSAYRELRTAATEYLDEDIEPEKAGSFVLRPALETFYSRQHTALQDLLDGFESRAALETWLHDLDRATHGGINAVERQLEMQFDVQLVSKPTIREAMLSPDGAEAQNARERIAARWLLPACNLSVRQLAAQVGESPDTVPESMPAPPG